ncbi:MAG: Mrp/NBP35 family ATP-binding protein [Acidobacteriota bacterium]|nr:Mrp/NBP35 family ATP-binding protein [Acidobacteriota bacterium]
MRVTPQQVLQALSSVKAAGQDRDIVALGRVKDLEVGDNRVSFSLQMDPAAGKANADLLEKARAMVTALGVADVRVAVAQQQKPVSGAAPQNDALIPGVKTTIAVASGKGGVGKSTLAVNLAVALSSSGSKTGLMDTDVYGPSVPHLMGSRSGPVVEGGKIAPPVQHGIKMISMAYFLPPGEAVIWRGPMLHKAIHQFLGDVLWGELDYLVIDLPPGTGDIQLSLSQTIPLTGAVIVSTPQDVALSVASKAIAMFNKLNTPILGIVENMSYYSCPHCGQREDIFGHGGARAAAERMHLPFLGEIPLDARIRKESDEGRPMALDASTAGGKAFREVARAVIEQVRLTQERAGQEIRIE